MASRTPPSASIASAAVLQRRASGILLHPTSLPGPYGVGDVGRHARHFIDFLAKAEQTYWQLLPVGPIGYGNSPYSAESAFAGSPLLIDPEGLVQEGLLDRSALTTIESATPERVDYSAATRLRERFLRAAFEAFQRAPRPARYEAFCHAQADWLDEFALFRAIKRASGGGSWVSWEPPLRDRRKSALDRARTELAPELVYEKFLQFIFSEQWHSMKDYARSRGIALIGDVPIFVAHDSADVWQHQELFRLGDHGEPSVVAGVPPDYFSATGQRWGNPVYRWKRMKKDDYGFWRRRLKLTLSRFDVVRLDHFIGFVRGWEIPATEPTAVRGRYVKGPGAALFRAIRAELGGHLPLIAEDLGAVTDEVRALRDRLGLPGLRILQFAFGTDPCAPDFRPHNYVRSTVAYTGTHDNDTTVGWFHERGGTESGRSEAQTENERVAVLAYLGTSGREIHWEMIREAMRSVANVAIVPLQDVLGLGTEARMNRPGTAEGNWEWRLSVGALTSNLAERLAGLVHTYDRAPAPSHTDPHHP
jgi:4-alpha-glucanotransferase